MKLHFLTIILLSFVLLACKNDTASDKNKTPSNTQEETVQQFKNKGHQLVYNMAQKVGNYNVLLKKKDVVYTYTYQTPDGKTDISTEKYMFDGEFSYGSYTRHERTFPDLEGTIEQGFDGSEYWLKHEGKIITDEARLKRVAFNRPTNYYWFTMMQKLLDPGLNYEYLEEKTINNTTYDVVKVTFKSEDGKPKDIYQLYLNKKTSLVDQFLFTVADFGKMEIPNLMQLQYEEIDGMLIPTKREYKKSTWDAEVSEDPWITVNWSNIKFNNNLTEKDFKKSN